MFITKSRMQGSSVVVTFPSKDGKKPEPNKEYIIIYSEDDSITLVPKTEDPFKDASEGEFYEADEWSDIEAEGRVLL